MEELADKKMESKEEFPNPEAELNNEGPIITFDHLRRIDAVIRGIHPYPFLQQFTIFYATTHPVLPTNIRPYGHLQRNHAKDGFTNVNRATGQ